MTSYQKNWPKSRLGFEALQNAYGSDADIAEAMNRTISSVGDQRRLWGLPPGSSQNYRKQGRPWGSSTKKVALTEEQIAELYREPGKRGKRGAPRVYEDVQLRERHRPAPAQKPLLLGRSK